MEFFSLTSPWYDHTRKRQFLFISLYPLSFDEGRTSGAGVRPLSSSAQPALRRIRNGRRGQAPALRAMWGPNMLCAAVTAKVFRRHSTDGGPAGQAGTAQRLSGPAGWSMRAAQGAAAPVTKPKKEPGVDARPVLALSVQLSAAMNPRIGGSRVGEAPRPFFPPISSGRNGGARRAGIRREAGPPPDGRILSAPTGLAVGVPRWAGPPPGDTPVSGQNSAPPGIRAALVFTALRGNTPNQGWQAAACRGCCAGR